MERKRFLSVFLISMLLFTLMPFHYLNVSATITEPAVELALNKPVSASSERTSIGRVASNANNGDLSTQWESSSVPAHITIDLESAYDVNKVIMFLGENWTARTLTIAVEGSLDGEHYMTLVPYKDYRFERSPKNKHEVTFDTTHVRYVRFSGTYNSNPGNFIQFTNLEVYQDPTFTEDGDKAPNLTATNLSWEPVNAFEEDLVVLQAEVQNKGDADYAGDLTLYYTIGDETITGSAQNVVIPRGWKANVSSSPWTAVSHEQQTVTVSVYGFEESMQSFPIRIHDERMRLPSEWTYSQIGNHALPGSAVYENGKYTIESSGNDISGKADEFVFVHQKITGDIAVSAKIVSQTMTSSLAGTGIMFREDTSESGNFVGLRLLANGALLLESRSNNGTVTAETVGQSLSKPKYIKLERADDLFTAYSSEDGVQWSAPLASRQQQLNDELVTGLIATSKNRSLLSKAELEDVWLEKIAKPDLIVTNVILTPAAPKPGEEVTLTAEIKNRGLTATRQKKFTVGFKINPSVADEVISKAVHNGIISPGETVTVKGKMKWTAEKGTHAVQAVADLEGQVEESNALNNDNIRYIAVRGEKPESEMTEFEKRALYVLETFANHEPEQTDRTRWVKEAVFYAQARFELGIDVETAIEYIKSINDSPGNAAMFFYTSNIDTYLRYGHLYPESLREKVKQRMTAKDYSDPGSTENHYIKYRTAGYLTAQTWPDWEKAAETKAFTERDLKNMMERFVKYGMKEYDSTTYWALYVECLLMLHELAEDPEMRRMAKMTLDWIMANTAGEWINGYWVSSTLRDYTGVSPKMGAAGTIMAWLYFGGDEYPVLRYNDYSYVEGMYTVQAAISSYRVPDILSRIVSDRSTPHLHLESHDQHPTTQLNWPQGYRKTSYITENYGVASQFDGYGTLGFSDQMRRWFVRWVSEEPYSTFFMTHPKRGGILSGATKYEQVIQKDGTVVAVYNIPDGDPYSFINGPFPNALHQIVEDPSGWIFGHGGNVLLAVNPLKPYVWTEESIGTLSLLAIPVLRSDSLKNGVIVETADPWQYASEEDNGLSEEQRRSNELERFAQAIKLHTSVDASGIDLTNPSVTYQSLAGDTLSITYNGVRSINGEAIDYTAWPLIGSPFMNQEVGGNVLTIQHGGETVVYDFMNWEIR